MSYTSSVFVFTSSTLLSTPAVRSSISNFSAGFTIFSAGSASFFSTTCPPSMRLNASSITLLGILSSSFSIYNILHPSHHIVIRLHPLEINLLRKRRLSNILPERSLDLSSGRIHLEIIVLKFLYHVHSINFLDENLG